MQAPAVEARRTKVKKSEMNASQLKDRKLFVDKLTKAGWSGTLQNEQFDEGLWVSPEATMEYSSKTMSLRFDFVLKDPRLILYLDSKEGKILGLVLRCMDRVDAIVEAVIAIQDTVDAGTLKKSSEQLLDACPEMFKISASGDKEVPVKKAKSR